MKRKLTILLVVLGLAAVVVASVLSARSGGGALVEVEHPQKRNMTRLVKATGTITPKTKVDVSAKVTGEVVELAVREGAKVREGQFLLRIEDEIYRAALKKAEAALAGASASMETAQVELEQATREWQRAERLFAEGLLSRQELDQARSRKKAAEASLRVQEEAVKQARWEVERARENLARTVIRAPMDGTVISLDVEKGETVVPGTTNLPGSVLMTIADTSELLVELDVSEVDVVYVEAGQDAKVMVDPLEEEEFRGHVIQVAASGRRDPDGVVKFPVKVLLDEGMERLKPGMTARVEIITGSKNALTVPVQAVVRRRFLPGGKEAKGPVAGGREAEVVYVVRNGKAQAVEVETGYSDELWVEVAGELAPSDMVVVGPYRVLKSMRTGQRVRTRSGEGRASNRG